MKKLFVQFLIEKGYKEFTPSGHPSTVYDYSKRIDSICEWEGISWERLAEDVKNILPQYEKGGEKEALGAKSHNAVRSALRCFAQFVLK